MATLSFKRFLLKEVRKHVNDMYDTLWRPRFDALEPKRQKHFAHLFPQGQNRIYIPFNIPDKDIKSSSAYEYEESKKWQKTISDLIRPHGYKIQNWAKGIIVTPQKQTTTIGRVLFKLNPELAKEYDRWTSGRDGGVRIGKNNRFIIVISQDSHDIARQSTGRNWTSCTELNNVLPEDEEDRINSRGEVMERGYTFNKLAKEILEGGLIAYLCYEHDKDIKSPLARISIKRYENNIDGSSIALCNSGGNMSVYGNNLLGKFFNNKVVEWLYDKQSIRQLVGVFKKVGAGGVDGHKYEVDLTPDKSQPITQKMIDYYLSALDYYKDDEYQRDNISSKIYYQLISQPSWNIPEYFWKKIKPYIINILDELKVKNFIKKFPNKLLPEDALGMSRRELSELYFSSHNSNEEGANYINKIKDLMLDKINSISSSDDFSSNYINNIIKYMKVIPGREWFGNIENIFNYIFKAYTKNPSERHNIFDFVLGLRYGLYTLGGNEEKLKYYNLTNKFIEDYVDKLEIDGLDWISSDIRHYISSNEEKNIPVPNIDLAKYTRN